jgi:transposase-like protein
MLRADHGRPPFSKPADKHASYSDAFTASQKEKVLPLDCNPRKTRNLNNIGEQDHHFVRRRRSAMQCFRPFHTAEWTLEGVEAMLMKRKGQVKRLDRNNSVSQAIFIAGLFQVAA